MVSLDLDCGGRDIRRGRLDDVGVERALGEEVDVAEAQGLGLEDGNELAADDPPLLLGVDHSAQRLQEPIGGVDVADVHVEVAVHYGQHALRFFLAQQAVVDEHARQLVPDGAVDERTTRQRADHPTTADLSADALCRLGDE